MKKNRKSNSTYWRVAGNEQYCSNGKGGHVRQIIPFTMMPQTGITEKELFAIEKKNKLNTEL